MLPHRRNMLNETETALNVNAPCSCKYSIIFCLTSQSEPRILFRSPRSVVGWFPPYTKIRTDGCCLSNQHSASTHIIHWIQTCVLIWILSNRTAHWFIGFCDWILLREKTLWVVQDRRSSFDISSVSRCFQFVNTYSSEFTCFLLPNLAENRPFMLTVYFFLYWYYFFIFATCFCRISRN